MRTSIHVACAALSLSLSAFATPQGASEDRATFDNPSAGGVTEVLAPAAGAPRALGSLLQGPLDASSGILASPSPGANWNRLLGCGYGWGYYWVSGGAGTTGAFAIHQYDTSGNYLQSFTQDMSLATASQWGIRDLAIDEANFKLWGGMEGRVFKEYTFDPNAGPNGTLNFTTTYLIPTGGTFGSSVTIRALARNPNTGNFYTKNFNTALWEFSIAGGVPTFVAEHATSGKSSYGLAWDTVNGTLWSFDQNLPGGAATGTDGVEFNECDTAGVLTGRSFVGTVYGVAGTNIAGGADIFDDGSGVLKVLALHQNTIDELNVYEMDPTFTPPTAYCTSGTTTQGCVPQLSANNPPSASNAGPTCVVTCSLMEEGRTGLMFFGLAEASPILPWGPTSTSFLCVKSPTNRTTAGASSTGPNAGDPCEGSLGIDFSAWMVANPAHLGTPHSAGQQLYCQQWYRDPATAKTTSLSNGLILTFVP